MSVAQEMKEGKRGQETLREAEHNAGVFNIPLLLERQYSFEGCY
jgi:hypothetical protein